MAEDLLAPYNHSNLASYELARYRSLVRLLKKYVMIEAYDKCVKILNLLLPSLPKRYCSMNLLNVRCM